MNNNKYYYLSELMKERKESPLEDDTEYEEIPVIEKITSLDGRIHLRSDSKTRTKMILSYPGDIIISNIGATKGSIAINNTNKIISATIHYASYIPNNQKVYTEYLWWFLRSNSFLNMIKTSLHKGIKTELRPKKLLSIQIQLPIKSEQKKIINKINDIKSKYEELKDNINKNEENYSKIYPSYLDKTFKIYSHFGHFGEVMTFKPRSGPSFPTNPEWNGIPVLMPSSVTGFGVDIKKIEFGTGSEKINEKDLLSPNDIIIARGNKPDQVGNAGVVPSEADGWVCANLLMKIKVDNSVVDPRFCVYWLQTTKMRKHVKQNLKGTNPSIQKINQKIIMNYPFPKYTSKYQQKIIINKLDKMKILTEKLNLLYKNRINQNEILFHNILDKVMSFNPI